MEIRAMSIYDEQETAYSEASYWEQLKEAVNEAIYQAEKSRADTIRETGNELTPEYDQVGITLSRVHDFIDGRIEELVPGTYKHKQEVFRYASPREKEAMSYALQEGINYVALTRLYPIARRLDAIEYISEHKLATRSYEGTCHAVLEYEANTGIKVRAKETAPWA